MHEITSEQKRVEAQARRAARRVGLIARKSRQRANVPHLDNFGEFRLIELVSNGVVAGARFELTAQDVLEFCARFK